MEPLSASQRLRLDGFLAENESQAYKMAFALTHHRDDALELVQDSMLKLVQKYRHKPPEEWRLLLFRILQNCIRDFHRKQGLRKFVQMFVPGNSGTNHDCKEQCLPSTDPTPAAALQQIATLETIQAALESLPLRQQQTFLLRAWLEFNTQETAFALSISEGSVKTHYNRARQRLQNILGEQYATT